MRPLHLPADIRGMTLIELMISIVLGLLLVAIVGQIYVGTKATYNKQEDLSRLQENGQAALTIISRTVRISGFKSAPDADATYIFTSSAPAIKGSTTAGNDEIIIRFQGSGDGAGMADNSIIDCLGVARDANVMNYNRFYIASNATTLRPGLWCDTSDDSAVDGTEIVSDVENMSVLYGGDIGADNAVDYYVSAANVPNWDLISSVRIGLVAATPNATINPQLDTSTYTVLGNTYDPVDDRRSRRVYSITIALRMRTP